MLYHKTCGGKLLLDLSEMLTLVSPGITITQKGVFPGVTEVKASQKRQKTMFLCNECNAKLSTKDDFMTGIVSQCSFCLVTYEIGELVVLENGPFICKDCLSGKTNNDFLSMYAELLEKDKISLLTLLLKK